MRLPFELFFLVAAVPAQFINPNADAFSVVFSNNASIGPDGPWWFIPQAIDFPDQIVNMLPGITQLSLAVAESACSSQSATCPLPIPTLWQESGAWDVSGGPKTISKAVAGTEWDAWTSALLRLKGSGKFFQERITLYMNGEPTSDAFLDNHGMMVSNDYKATFPGGAEYTLDTGFLSLYGKEDTISWKSAMNGSTVTWNRTLPDAYLAGYSPSVGYGLHVGSATHNVTASLVIGGYDSSRCLTEPIISSADDSSLQLSGISLNVASGGSAYSKTASPSTNLLKDNGDTVTELKVYANPAVPYLYLPRDTCDAIAAYLPVTYSSDFNLYFWDTRDPTYEQIISSPHYVSFTFMTSSGQTPDINIPFALLNLTLESPLGSTSTPYFPCSPWTEGAAPYHLGRAFLQGAFLAQNWQTNKLFLAQAPGPDLDLLPPYVKNIASKDTALTPATNPPDWATTWSSVLKPLDKSVSSSNDDSEDSGISSGVIAGVVIGVIAAIAIIAGLLFWILRRRKRRSTAQGYYQQPAQELASPPAYYDGSVYAKRGAHTSQIYEADAISPPQEMEGFHVTELPADDPRKRVGI